MASDPVDTLQPVMRRELFWDVPLDHIDVYQHAEWLIARVLWRGALDDVGRIIRVYGAARVAAAARSHGGLPPLFRPFWVQVLSKEVAPAHPETLAPPVQSVLMEHGQTLCPPGFLLCGGTAVALHLGHRRSLDLDLFTGEPFEAPALAERLRRQLPGYRLDAVSSGTVHGRLDGVEISHIHQIGVDLAAQGAFAGVPVASPPSLCAMKCNALAMRGDRKDFIDIYALALDAGGISRVLELAFQHAPGLNRVHVLRSLTAFENAEASPMPDMLAPWAWETVRDAMARFAQAEARRQLGLGQPGA